MSKGRSVTQDPIEQVLHKLGSYGVPVTEIGEKAGALVGQIRLVGPASRSWTRSRGLDPSQIDVGEMLGELKAKFDELPPELKVPVMVAAGFVGARVVRWVVR